MLISGNAIISVKSMEVLSQSLIHFRKQRMCRSDKINYPLSGYRVMRIGSRFIILYTSFSTICARSALIIYNTIFIDLYYLKIKSRL